MISQIIAATSSYAHSRTRRPTARLAIPAEAITHITTPSATRFSVPGRSFRDHITSRGSPCG
jgi:hypothetical protein